MDSKQELATLAHLLDISASTARQIAHFEQVDAAQIHWLAHQIEEIAFQMKSMAGIRPNIIQFTGNKTR